MLLKSQKLHTRNQTHFRRFLRVSRTATGSEENSKQKKAGKTQSSTVEDADLLWGRKSVSALYYGADRGKSKFMLHKRTKTGNM